METLHYAWDEDAYDRSKETLHASFERGTRSTRAGRSSTAGRTTAANAGAAARQGSMDAWNAGAAAGAYVVPPVDRCVIDGLGESALFTVGT